MPVQLPDVAREKNYGTIWKGLIWKAMKTSQYQEQEVGTLQIGDEVAREILFCYPASWNGGLPKVGAAIVMDECRIEYSYNFFHGQPSAYGRIIFAETTVVREKQTTHSDLPTYVDPTIGVEFGTKYDEVVIMAMVHVLGKRILHSVQVDSSDRLRSEMYAKRGYTRSGQYFEKIYEPE